jgi:hypothetical protein
MRCNPRSSNHICFDLNEDRFIIGTARWRWDRTCFNYTNYWSHVMQRCPFDSVSSLSTSLFKLIFSFFFFLLCMSNRIPPSWRHDTRSARILHLRTLVYFVPGYVCPPPFRGISHIDRHTRQSRCIQHGVSRLMSAWRLDRTLTSLLGYVCHILGEPRSTRGRVLELVLWCSFN